MKIVVLGGTGLIGAKVVHNVAELGHEAVSASRNSGVDTVTGEGLDRVMVGADAVVDVTDAQSLEEVDARAFFGTSTTNVLAAEARAGVGHHVALSVVGADELTASGYFQAKVEQEALVAASPVPHTIVHATPLFEFVERIADESTVDEAVRLASVLFQPMASQDVADALAGLAAGEPGQGVVELAGPEQYRLDQLVRLQLGRRDGDRRHVVTDPHALFFGSRLAERTLIPEGSALLGQTRFEEWLAEHTPQAQ